MTTLELLKEAKQRLEYITPEKFDNPKHEESWNDCLKRITEHIEKVTKNEIEVYRQEAKNQYHREGEVEIDDNAEVSFSEDGAYVQAWVFYKPSVEDLK